MQKRNLNRATAVLFAVVAIVPTGCERGPHANEEGSEKLRHRNESKAHLTVHWEGSIKLEDAAYFVDGKFVGVGVAGFDTVLEQMADLEHGSEVLFSAPLDHWVKLQETFDVIQEIPVDEDNRLYNKFRAVCSEKQLKTAQTSKDAMGDEVPESVKNK